MTSSLKNTGWIIEYWKSHKTPNYKTWNSSCCTAKIELIDWKKICFKCKKECKIKHSRAFNGRYIYNPEN